MGREKKRLGEWGEDLAVNFLRRHHFVVVERNFQTVYGEIDIVAKFGDDFYFVEVKTRRDQSLANDLAVGYHKRLAMDRALKKYCLKRGVGDCNLLTAIIVVWPNKQKMTAAIRFVVLRNTLK